MEEAPRILKSMRRNFLAAWHRAATEMASMDDPLARS